MNRMKHKNTAFGAFIYACSVIFFLDLAPLLVFSPVVRFPAPWPLFPARFLAEGDTKMRADKT